MKEGNFYSDAQEACNPVLQPKVIWTALFRELVSGSSAARDPSIQMYQLRGLKYKTMTITYFWLPGALGIIHTPDLALLDACVFGVLDGQDLAPTQTQKRYLDNGLLAHVLPITLGTYCIAQRVHVAVQWILGP